VEKKTKHLTIPDKIPKRYLVVYDSIFKRRVHVLLNHTPKEYAKWLTKIKATDDDPDGLDDFSGFSSLISVGDRPTEFLIYIKHFDWCIKDQGTLIHEIVHTVIKIFSSNNIPFNHDTQEFIAHAVANLYEDIVHKLLVPTYLRGLKRKTVAK
jgi:hypothetical protein